MKLATLLEDRVELLHLQQFAIDQLDDDFDVELNNFRGREVVTVSIYDRTYALMPTPLDADKDHSDSALVNAATVAELSKRVSVFSGLNTAPIPISAEIPESAAWRSYSNAHVALSQLKFL